MNLRAQKKRKTSARLVQTARRFFFEQGYAQASMDEICAEAGVTRGALYHNFGGKKGLFEAVIRQLDEEIGVRILDSEGPGPLTLDGFIATCKVYLRMALDPEIQKLVFIEGPAVLGQRLRDIDQEGSIVPIRDAIAELQQTGRLVAADPESLAILLNGAMIDASLWIARGDDPRSRLSPASQSLECLVRGLAA